MIFTQYCKFGCKVTTNIWNIQGFLQENAKLFKFYTLKAALIPPFVVQSRSHLVRITDIYVPSFSYVHSPALNAGFHFVHCPAFIAGILGGRVDRRTPSFINLTHAWVCIIFTERVSARPPGLPSAFYILRILVQR